MTDPCPCCGADPHPDWAPWCGRSCRTFSQRQSKYLGVDYDIVAKRMLVLTKADTRRLNAMRAVAERRLRAWRAHADELRGRLEAALRASAAAHEQLEVLRWYAPAEAQSAARAEMLRRQREGRRSTDPGARVVKEDLPRQLAEVPREPQ